MSYYSEVAIALSRKGFDRVSELYKQKYPNKNIKKDFIIYCADNVYSDSKEILVFSFNWYNHWDSLGNGQELEGFLQTLNDEGYSYNLCKIGEELEDIVLEIRGGTKEDDICVLSYLRTIELTNDKLIEIDDL